MYDLWFLSKSATQVIYVHCTLSWVWMRSFSMFPTCKSPVALHLDCTLICPYYIVEEIGEVLLGPSKLFHFVSFLNQLAVSANAKHPSQSCPISKDHVEGNPVTFIRQETVKLISCHFIIGSQLLFHYCSISSVTFDGLLEPTLLLINDWTSRSILLQKFVDANPGTFEILRFCSSFAMAGGLRPHEAKERICCFLYTEKAITFTCWLLNGMVDVTVLLLIKWACARGPFHSVLIRSRTETCHLVCCYNCWMRWNVNFLLTATVCGGGH